MKYKWALLLFLIPASCFADVMYYVDLTDYSFYVNRDNSGGSDPTFFVTKSTHLKTGDYKVIDKYKTKYSRVIVLDYKIGNSYLKIKSGFCEELDEMQWLYDPDTIKIKNNTDIYFCSQNMFWVFADCKKGTVFHFRRDGKL